MVGSPGRQHSAPAFNRVALLGVLAVAGCTFSPRVAAGKISCASAAECPTEVPVCQMRACYPLGWDGGTVDVPVMPATDTANDSNSPIDSNSASDSDSDGAIEVGVDVTPMNDWPNCVPPAAPNLASGLVFYLHLDETGSNPVIADASPNHIGTAVSNLGSGAAWTAGRFGGALALAGGAAGGWITLGGVPAPPALNAITDQVSLSVWVKFPPGTPPDGVLLSRQAVGPHGYLYRFSIAGGRLRAQLHTANGNNANLTANRPLDETGRWMHLAVTYGDTGAGVEVYVDGESHGADRAFALQLGLENSPVLVGGAENPQAAVPGMTIIDRFAGIMDDVAVFKRTLTAGEIKALSCGAMPMDPATTTMTTSRSP